MGANSRLKVRKTCGRAPNSRLPGGYIHKAPQDVALRVGYSTVLGGYVKPERSGAMQDHGFGLLGTLLLRTSVNKGAMRKCLTFVNSTDERSKESPELEAFLGSGLSLSLCF